MDYKRTSFRLPPQQAEELHERLWKQYDDYYTRRCAESDEEIAQRWNRDFSSLKAYEASIEPNREHFLAMLGGWPWERGDLQAEVIDLGGTDQFTVQRVFITSFDAVRMDFLLLVPRELSGPTPAILAQHGLGGMPDATCGFIDQGEANYHSFGSRLAELGYVVAAPHMMGGASKRNWLQRKAMLMGECLTGAEMFGLSRVVDYLQGLEYVDGERIGLYGLSQGGMTAQLLPALEKRIKVTVICGNFTWRWPKMVIPGEKYVAYICTDEEDKFFAGQLLEFSDADVCSLICPRCVFIESGANDAVLHPQVVEKEWPKLQAIYEQLGIPERVGIEVHPGEHEVWFEGAVEFLRKWL
ncbi:MAG: prolyl oligopeptidase family serine peptidase [candidate division WS1 bacterium]|nr:prolyl oligopeptidase family serine peptidase [candidate division WS1 bacterium]